MERWYINTHARMHTHEVNKCIAMTEACPVRGCLRTYNLNPEKVSQLWTLVKSPIWGGLCEIDSNLHA